jgi:hypothetical protein
MVIHSMDGDGADSAAAGMDVKRRFTFERTVIKIGLLTSEEQPCGLGRRSIEVWRGTGLENARVGLERKWAKKSSKIRGKKYAGNDFLIDARQRKVVISNSSGNYNNLPAFH